jgi:hypothetical protein
MGPNRTVLRAPIFGVWGGFGWVFWGAPMVGDRLSKCGFLGRGGAVGIEVEITIQGGIGSASERGDISAG